MFVFWIAVGIVMGRATSPETLRYWRWRVTRAINGDANGRAVDEYIHTRKVS